MKKIARFLIVLAVASFALGCQPASKPAAPAGGAGAAAAPTDEDLKAVDDTGGAEDDTAGATDE